jgi:hypothetical protein
MWHSLKVFEYLYIIFLNKYILMNYINDNYFG